MDTNLLIAIFLAIVAILILRTIIHIVPEYQRLVVLFFGRFQSIAGPGLVLLLPPPIQTSQIVDLREFVVEIPQQTCISKDNAPISIDFLIYQKVVDPKDSFLNIQNFRQAIQGIATTTLRAVVGNIPLDDVLAKREQINEELRVKLDDITHRWGVKVTNVEIIRQLLGMLGKPDGLIQFVPDRPGHDRRYAMDIGKIRSQLGWAPKYRLVDGLADTVAWYCANRTWWERVLTEAYRAASAMYLGRA